jgi:hypothetical protein
MALLLWHITKCYNIAVAFGVVGNISESASSDAHDSSIISQASCCTAVRGQQLYYKSYPWGGGVC